MATRALKGLWLAGSLLVLALGATRAATADAHGPELPPMTASTVRRPVAQAAQEYPGRRPFQQYCAPCHGPKGLGNGPAAAAFKPPPANYTDPDGVAKLTDDQLIEVITKGRGSMPAWGPILSQDQIVALVAYIRALSRGEG